MSTFFLLLPSAGGGGGTTYNIYTELMRVVVSTPVYYVVVH